MQRRIFVKQIGLAAGMPIRNGCVNPLTGAIIRDSWNGCYPSDHCFVFATVSF